MKTNKEGLCWALLVSAVSFFQAHEATAAERGEPRAGPGTTLLDDRKSEKGFKSIFNGKDLTGWDGNLKLWSVRDGVITGQTTKENPAKGNTFLIWTAGEVGDFELRCSFKIVPGTEGFANSGIQYRSKIIEPKNWVVGGYQADMEAGPKFTGILYEEKMTRGIMAARGEKVVWNKDCNKEVVGSLGSSEELQAVLKPGDWNDYVVIAKGNHLQHFINGKQMVDVIDDCEAKRAMSGVLALQLHAGTPMMVQFRNLRINTQPGERAASGDELKKLQGAWQMASMENQGTSVPHEDIQNITVAIKGSSYEVLGIDGSHSGTFTIDDSKRPKEMDIKSEAGSDSGEILKAIYELDGDNFRVCYARGDAPRPKDFSAPENSRQLLITYQRKVNK
jgi:uncharacterized protein (TIGR03067 family)